MRVDGVLALLLAAVHHCCSHSAQAVDKRHVQLAQFNLQQRLLLLTTARCSKGDCLAEVRVHKVTAAASDRGRSSGFILGPAVHSGI